MTNRLSQILLESFQDVDLSEFDFRDMTDTDREFQAFFNDISNVLDRFENSRYPRDWNELVRLGERVNSVPNYTLSTISLVLKKGILKRLEKMYDFYLNFDKHIVEYKKLLKNELRQPFITEKMWDQCDQKAQKFIQFVHGENNVSLQAEEASLKIEDYLTALKEKILQSHLKKTVKRY